MKHTPTATLEERLGLLLGGGTWIACTVIAVGLCARLSGFVASGDHVMRTGVGMIIALPVVRLTTMLGYFSRRGQGKLAAICALVLVIVAAGVTLGLSTRG